MNPKTHESKNPWSEPKTNLKRQGQCGNPYIAGKVVYVEMTADYGISHVFETLTPRHPSTKVIPKILMGWLIPLVLG